MSLLDGGRRNADGSFVAVGSSIYIHVGNEQWAVSYSSASFFQGDTSDNVGAYLRLFSNTPYLTTNLYESGWFATDIASTQKSQRIAFGCAVTSITIKCNQSLTNIEAKLFSYAGVELETLMTGKSCNATTKTFAITVDQTVSYTDNYIRLTATGNSGGLMCFTTKVEIV